MLNITKHSENGVAFLGLEGELNTVTANDLNQELEDFLDGITDLTIDLEGLTYITSAGLRIFLVMEQRMERQGAMKVLHVSDSVMDVFEVSGFTKVLNIL